MNFLPVRCVASRERAEELDLLLQSLGIDVRLFFDEQAEQGPWVIAVEAARQAEAQQVIDEEEVVAPTLAPLEPVLGARARLYWIAGLVLINTLIWWAMEHRGGSQNHATLLHFGAIKSELLAAGEWWRAVTAIFLHIGVRHLIGNMALLMVFGGLSLHIWGPGRLLFIYVMSGVFGNWAGFLFGSATALKAGASGAILGLLGALAGARLLHLRSPQHRSRFKSWHVLAMLIAFYGFVVGVRPSSDHVAHLGGLLSGGLIAVLLPPLSGSKERKLQLVVGLIAAALCLASGFLAARAGS